MLMPRHAAAEVGAAGARLEASGTTAPTVADPPHFFPCVQAGGKAAACGCRQC
jgi:hypothetical protein